MPGILRINPRFELELDYIEALKATDHWAAPVVNREMILIDGFHRLEAAKRRGDEEIEVEVRDTEGDDLLALAAKLNVTHGKRLTVLELVFNSMLDVQCSTCPPMPINHIQGRMGLSS